MMLYLDQFIDTKAKRYHLYFMIFAILLLCIILPYIIFGYTLIKVNDYDSIFALLDHPLLLKTYLSRMIVAIMAIGNMSIFRVIKELLLALSATEVIAIMMFAIGFYPLVNKKVVKYVLALINVELIIVFICSLLALNSATLSDSFIYIHIIGYSFIIIFAILAIIIFMNFLRQFHQYRIALHFECIEMYDDAKED